LLDRITPLILTRNEEANIGRTLAQLAWAREVIVVDSLSSDATAVIARRFPNVRLVERAFDSHAAQWTFGAAQVITDWVLTLDADYYVPEAFVREISSLDPPPDVAGYEAAFTYAINGRPLRATLYTPRVVLLRRGAFEIWQDGHTQRVRVNGRVERLRTRLIHDDRKSLRRFIERQRVYMRREAEKLRAPPFRPHPQATSRCALRHAGVRTPRETDDSRRHRRFALRVGEIPGREHSLDRVVQKARMIRMSRINLGTESTPSP
jgi:glycosyltransferase involved in cell wall biosynthesis